MLYLKMSLVSIMIGIVILQSSLLAVASNQVIIGVSEIPNLLSQSEVNKGPYNEVLDNIKAHNEQIEIFFIPPARADIMFEKKTIDCLFPASKTTISHPETLLQSDKLATIHAYIFSRKAYDDPSFFTGKSVAIRRGFTFGGVRNRIDASYIELENETAGLQFLAKHRVEGVIGYLPDILGAQQLLGLSDVNYFYKTPIYSANEAIVCHKNESNRQFINQVNEIFKSEHVTLPQEPSSLDIAEPDIR
jgi:ABC-type amino acid transport substrate-binding protein